MFRTVGLVVKMVVDIREDPTEEHEVVYLIRVGMSGYEWVDSLVWSQFSLYWWSRILNS